MQRSGTYTAKLWEVFPVSVFHDPASSLPGAAALLTAAFLSACAALPPRAPVDPARDAQDFAARRLDGGLPDLPRRRPDGAVRRGSGPRLR